MFRRVKYETWAEYLQKLEHIRTQVFSRPRFYHTKPTQSHYNSFLPGNMPIHSYDTLLNIDRASTGVRLNVRRLLP